MLNKISSFRAFNFVIIWVRNFLPLTALLFLSGCGTHSNKLVYDVTANGSVELSRLNHWQIKARIAVQTPEDNVSATLDWTKKANDFDFHIYGMLGATYAHLIQNGNDATLMLPDDQVFHHYDAEQLLLEAIGWDFPVDALSFWVKGLPSGFSGETFVRDNDHRMASLSYGEWQVSFDKYQTFSGYDMPKMIKATHPRLSLKIVVKDWTFLPTESASSRLSLD